MTFAGLVLCVAVCLASSANHSLTDSKSYNSSSYGGLRNITSSDSRSTIATSSRSSHGLGFYIAAGLGQSSTEEGQQATASQASYTGRSIETTTQTTNPRSSLANSTQKATAAFAPTSTGASSSAALYPTGNASSIGHNGTAFWPSVSNADQCWQEWQRYWAFTTTADYSTSSYTTTESFIETLTQKSQAATTSLHTYVTSFVETQMNGDFPEATVTILSTQIWPVTYSEQPASTWVYSVTPQTWTEADQITVSNTAPMTPTPSCRLPSLYSKCQSEWVQYASYAVVPSPPLATSCYVNLLTASTYPPCYMTAESSVSSWGKIIESATPLSCSQASITGALCTSLIDAYVIGDNYNLVPSGVPTAQGMEFSQGWYRNMWNTIPWQWPTSATFAPGCTLGCGRCAVTGGTIQLLYFPPGLSHPATAPAVATTLGTVLTSPTYYLSFASVYASDACSGIGGTITSTIVAIPTSDTLSSIWASNMPCVAQIEMRLATQIWYGTASFNVSDLLETPVPYSIFTSQPYCASEIFLNNCNASSCPRTQQYTPLVVVSDAVLQSLDPIWASCSADLRGLYDPPRALQPAATEEGPVSTVADPQTESTKSATASTTASPAARVTTVPSATPAPTDLSGTSHHNPSATSPKIESTGETSSSLGSDPSDPSTNIQQSATDQPTHSSQPIAPQVTYPSQSTASLKVTSEADPAGAIASVLEHTSVQDPVTPMASESQQASHQAASINALSVLSEAESTSTSDAFASPMAGSVAVDPITAVGGMVISADPSFPGGVIVAGATMKPGDITTIDNTPVSIGTAGVLVSGSTVALYPIRLPTESAVAMPVALDPSLSGAVIVAGHTLTPGAVTIIDNSPVSVGIDRVIMAGSTMLFPSAGIPLATISSQTLSLDPSNPHDIVVAGQTLSPGEATTIGQMPVSIGTEEVVVASSTITIPSVLAATDQSGSSTTGMVTPTQSDSYSSLATTDGSGVQTFVVGSLTVTALPNDPIVIGGITLSSGGPEATILGQTLSVGASDLVINGTSTVQFSRTAMQPSLTGHDTTAGASSTPGTVKSSSQSAAPIASSSVPTAECQKSLRAVFSLALALCISVVF